MEMDDIAETAFAPSSLAATDSEPQGMPPTVSELEFGNSIITVFPKAKPAWHSVQSGVQPKPTRNRKGRTECLR